MKMEYLFMNCISARSAVQLVPVPLWVAADFVHAKQAFYQKICKLLESKFAIIFWIFSNIECFIT